MKTLTSWKNQSTKTQKYLFQWICLSKHLNQRKANS